MTTRILQFGTGVLLRGLCDDIIDRARTDTDHPWTGSVAVVQSTGAARADALAKGPYPLLTRGLRKGEPVRTQRDIACITHAFAAERDWSDVTDLVRTPELTTIISNTTEAGLQPDPDDVPDDAVPKSFPAKLLRLLHTRHDAGLPPPVVVPCELIEHNGSILRNVLLDLCARFETPANVRTWIERDTLFADTLVDRICTRPEEPDAHELATVVEPFAMWAIAAPERAHPDLCFTWNTPGGILTDDVTPYFVRKVRVLNGAHTAVVNLGMLAGHETMRELCADELFSALLRTVLDREIVPPLVEAGVPDVRAFAAEVLDRFANPFTAHRLADIANGTAAKIDIRLVPTVNAHGTPPPCVCLGIAAWLERSGSDASEAWSGSMRTAVAHWRDELGRLGVRGAIESAVRASGG